MGNIVGTSQRRVNVKSNFQVSFFKVVSGVLPYEAADFLLHLVLGVCPGGKLGISPSIDTSTKQIRSHGKIRISVFLCASMLWTL